MAISSLKFVSNPHLHLRAPPFQCVRKVVPRCVAAVEAEDTMKEECSSSIPEQDEKNKKVPAWKKLNSKDLGIKTKMIAYPTRKVLNVLKKRGYDVYLVGGYVRDLILKRTPKDFDVITSTELKEPWVFKGCFNVQRSYKAPPTWKMASKDRQSRRKQGPLSWHLQ